MASAYQSLFADPNLSIASVVLLAIALVSLGELLQIRYGDTDDGREEV